MNHYTLVLRDKDSDAREEFPLRDPQQCRVPSTAAWVRASSDAVSWGKTRGFRCVLHEITDAVTGLSFGQHFVRIEAEQ